jgi:hypothetical protein
MIMSTVIRKRISESEFNQLKPFDLMSNSASEIMDLSAREYWFQVAFEVTRDCKRNGFAVLEAHKR